MRLIGLDLCMIKSWFYFNWKRGGTDSYTLNSPVYLFIHDYFLTPLLRSLTSVSKGGFFRHDKLGTNDEVPSGSISTSPFYWVTNTYRREGGKTDPVFDR